MARQMRHIIADLRVRIAELARQRDVARRENARLRTEAETLRQELAETRSELAVARQEVDFLTVSHRLADDPDRLVSARRRLQRLIAKIDRCVALLKEDADIS